MKTRLLVLSLLVVLSRLPPVAAAPSLSVTKPPVGPIPSYTGPTNDPNAVSGQWFRVVADSTLEYRPCEFHDNTANNGGGYMQSAAISGRVVNVVLGPIKIVAFDIQATIVNDTPGTGT